MAHKKKHNKRKQEKFKKKHPEGRVKFVASKELARQKKVQRLHQKRGRKGHNPKMRKIIK